MFHAKIAKDAKVDFVLKSFACFASFAWTTSSGLWRSEKMSHAKSAKDAKIDFVLKPFACFASFA